MDLLSQANAMFLEQGFSQDEINDMRRMNESVLLIFEEKNPTINWKITAILEADMLSQTGKTEKVRKFAAKIYKKLTEDFK